MKRKNKLLVVLALSACLWFGLTACDSAKTNEPHETAGTASTLAETPAEIDSTIMTDPIIDTEQEVESDKITQPTPEIQPDTKPETKPETEPNPEDFLYWYINGDVVLHQSFDELRKNGEESNGVFTAGQANSWDGVANLSDGATSFLHYWGWIAAKGGVGQFGYMIDDGKIIWDDSFAVEAEADVVNEVHNRVPGADTATRMLIQIDLSGLQDIHTVKALYKDTTGKVVILNEFTVIMTGGSDGSQQPNEKEQIVQNIAKYIIRNGTYDADDNRYTLTIGEIYSEGSFYTRKAEYDASNKKIEFFLWINADCMVTFVVDQTDYIYTWGYYDKFDNYFIGSFDANTYGANMLLGYAACNISDPALKATMRELASEMMNLLLLFLDEDLSVIGVTAEDLGFLKY